jgi:D-threo-aldose 1-dehydrogenase
LYAPVDDATAQAVIDQAWAGGVRYFDTAPHYGLGLSETRLGQALRERPRDEFVVSTKVGRLLVPHPDPTGCDLSAGGFAVPDTLTRRWDFSRDGVRRSLDESLRRLDVDRIDIVFLHDPDSHMDVALRQALPALAELRDAGVIRAIGAGMNFVDPLARLVAEADVDVVMIAGRWTLLDRSAAALLDLCQARGVAAIAAAPFNSGLLARAWPTDDANFDYGPATKQLLAAARLAARVCDDFGTTLAHAAMQFPLQHPAVACVSAGMRSRQEVAEDVGWASTDLPVGLLAALEATVSR